MSAPRTRFAPSPTGFLHIGGARTALFNWAYARGRGGGFLLRIEDTDQARSTRAFEQALLEGLRWLEIDWDGEPVRQSERREAHRAAVEKLLARGRAYRCICTREELEERRRAAIARGEKWTYDGRCRDAGLGPDCGPHTVRLRMPPSGRIAWQDLVFGPSGQDASEIGDRILMRADGVPVYHLAVVVDDLDMAITHVIRGADHHINTPLQLAIYRALEAEPPAFAHVPLIVGPGGKKLSKREGDVSVDAFREAGYLPEALRNWLVRIGWSHGDQEIFSRDEIVRLFDLEHVHRAPGQADPEKLAWLNQHYLRSLPADELFRRALPFLEREAGRPVDRTAELDRLLDLLRDRSRTLADMAHRAAFVLREEIEIDPKAAARHLVPGIAPALGDLVQELEALPDWSEESIAGAFERVLGRHEGLKMGRIAQAVRVAVTGSAASPGIFETLHVVGRDRALRRLRAALSRLSGNPPA